MKFGITKIYLTIETFLVEDTFYQLNSYINIVLCYDMYEGLNDYDTELKNICALVSNSEKKKNSTYESSP
jgi:hypothetical protein